MKLGDEIIFADKAMLTHYSGLNIVLKTFMINHYFIILKYSLWKDYHMA